MAETTTAILVPLAASLTTAVTAFSSFSWSAKEEPPNLTTIFLSDFSFTIQQPSTTQNLQNFSFVLGLVNIVIKVVAEAREL
jgi:hypothetical protein